MREMTTQRPQRRRVAVEKDAPVRSISRCIQVLRTINEHSSMSMTEISRTTSLPYGTTCRIVESLLFEGLIEREQFRPRYRPTALVHSLSQGFQNYDALVAAAHPHIVELTRQQLWPVAITTRVGQSMIVRDSTHALTSMTFHLYHPGYNVPIMGTAPGRCYLSFAPEDESARTLTDLRGTPQYEGDEYASLMESGKYFEQVRAQGYATKLGNQYTQTPGKTSSIGAPVFKDGQLIAVMILSYFTSTMRMSTAEEVLAPAILRTTAAIERSLAEGGHVQNHYDM
jgi:IclR family mhp operon transcriptional activator